MIGGQGREHREREDFRGCFVGYGERSKPASQIGILLVQRNRIVQARADLLGIQLVLQGVTVLGTQKLLALSY